MNEAQLQVESDEEQVDSSPPEAKAAACLNPFVSAVAAKTAADLNKNQDKSEFYLKNTHNLAKHQASKILWEYYSDPETVLSTASLHNASRTCISIGYSDRVAQDPA